MKAKLFIGSSAESLSVCYAIQDNLTYDADVTVWTQGIFELSSTSLDDLLKALSTADFAVFVFRHEDLTQMRNEQLNTVRDNVIFEFGLFIGRLGKEKVFFVVPEGEKLFHLPSDLLGLAPGTYNENRGDDNLQAALGPFCNQIRKRLRQYIHQLPGDLANETAKARQLAADQKPCWEYFLFAELLHRRLEQINRSYKDLDKGLLFIKTRLVTAEEFRTSCLEQNGDFRKLIELLYKLMIEEVEQSFGPPGVAGKIPEIKEVADRFYYLCNELIAWECRLLELEPPTRLLRVKELLAKWPRAILKQLNQFPNDIIRNISEQLAAKDRSTVRKVNFSLKLNEAEAAEISQCFKDYFGYPENGAG